MKLANLFSENTILQRDRPVPIWGWSNPGETVTVEFAGQKKSTVAGSDGKWTVILDPMPASITPRDLVVSALRDSPAAIRNVLVGDLWLCSGQSNMWWPVSSSNHAEAEMASANFPQIRLFAVPNIVQAVAPADVDTTWQPCSPESVKAFSAVGYFFGREVWQTTGIPIGLINCSWGGSNIEPWISLEGLLTDPIAGPVAVQVDTQMATPAGQAAAAATPFDHELWIQQQGRPDPGNSGFAAGWAAPDLNDRPWSVMELPKSWQSEGFNFSGVFWFRREVAVPAACAGHDLELHLGICDKTDTTYFNGVQVGATGFETKKYWDVRRAYPIPGKLVRPGRNVIATRVYSNFFQGGLVGPAECLQLVAPETPAIPLTGPWRYKVEHDFGYIERTSVPVKLSGPTDMYRPHILFDSMIAPLLPAAVRGVLWYQGESNVGAARHYRQLFPLLIRDWRRVFGQPELEFYFAQLTNHGPMQTAPVEHGWSELREAQTLALREPHTGMAVIIDLGEAEDIHPKNKQDVGKRLAQHALARVYGRPVVCNGPLYRSHRVAGDTVRIEFDSADGLTTNDGSPVKGFVVAGRDKRFVWAEARIEGTTVVVRSAAVHEPVMVRYAWAGNPPVNLYNGAGLPAAPFRTDRD